MSLFDPVHPLADSVAPDAPEPAAGESLPPLLPPVISRSTELAGRDAGAASVAVAWRRRDLRAARRLRLTVRGQVLGVVAAALMMAGISLAGNLGAETSAAPPVTAVQVLEGDTAASIAQRVAGPSEAEAVAAVIVESNGLDHPGATLRPGEIIVVPAP